MNSDRMLPAGLPQKHDELPAGVATPDQKEKDDQNHDKPHATDTGAASAPATPTEELP